MKQTELVVQQPALQTKRLVTVPLLSAVAFILMYMEFPVPLIPAFLKLDLSTLPALIGGLMFGPAVGIMIELIKNLLHLLLKNTDGMLIGEIANFIAGSCFVYGAVLMQKVRQGKAGLLMGLALGTIIMTVVMAVANVYVLFPAYAVVYQMSVEDLLRSFGLDSLWSLVMYAITPFNIIKGVVVSLIAYPIYVKLAPRLGLRR
ncbi:MAG TPA: ECF transporter S component [Candidatus Bathyarchaeia archaeon]|nr:ECF transporter S component [Candidatus Bathyarchaeia archaeon]